MTYGEEYSRERYDAAEREAREASRLLRERHTLLSKDSDAEQKIRKFQSAPAFKELERRARKAEKCLQKLFAAGYAEASELNVEYKRLWQDAESALERLDTFETERLGMGVREIRRVQ